MPMMPIWRSTASGSSSLVEAVVVRVGGVHGHQDGVEGMAADALHQRVGAVVAGDAEEAHHLLLLHFEQRFHGAALGEDRIHVGHGADIVQLPQVHVIGLEQLQRFFDHAHGAVAGALAGFGGEEGLVAAVGHHLAHVLLAPALRAAVDGRGVDVVDAQVERALDDGHGDVEVVGLLDRGLAAQREDADACSRSCPGCGWAWRPVFWGWREGRGGPWVCRPAPRAPAMRR